MRLKQPITEQEDRLLANQVLIDELNSQTMNLQREQNDRGMEIQCETIVKPFGYAVVVLILLMSKRHGLDPERRH